MAQCVCEEDEMRFTTKGIGWLIAGGIIAASSAEASGLTAKLSTIALGLVFILIYVMRQFFKPHGIGWFIAGGVLLAFSIEMGLDSSGLMGIFLGVVFLFLFYSKNKEVFDSMMAGTWEPDDDEKWQADPPEITVVEETDGNKVKKTVTVKVEEVKDADEVEFEFTESEKELPEEIIDDITE